ncbi:hypothetical protein HPP92_018560 [Vanilla planifolia]|uniref:DUF7815 domain-containing protein n=1 Tax=Vanilla planifolia TaxID=51239 RepID=A0A835QA20_VANPL|nr:hypothetical protein HPP92_018560 [Vanilla planifolia]
MISASRVRNAVVTPRQRREREREREGYGAGICFRSDADMQIRLRRSAGVPSYDHGDPALPSALNRRSRGRPRSLCPDYLCCRRCHGRLPRRVNSTICIFCGGKQRREGITMSMCFNSTAAYRNMLQSLDLDGK